jgi:hypothetical protein
VLLRCWWDVRRLCGVQAYFQLWWQYQSAAKQQTVKQLVQSGQLEFANGGWCMCVGATVPLVCSAVPCSRHDAAHCRHDEATTFYLDVSTPACDGERNTGGCGCLCLYLHRRMCL